jgi:undecaprenyl-diphosphatase
MFLVLNRDAGNPFFDWLFPILTNMHHHAWFFIVVALFLIAIIWKGNRRVKLAVLCALIALGLSDMVGTRVFKRHINRLRPCAVVRTAGHSAFAFPSDRLVGGCPGPGSFPSNHAANMMALGLTFWAFSTTRKRWLWFLLPLIIGYTRIYLGYHYPSDVVGGWLIGACMASITLLAASKLARGHLFTDPAR